MPTVHDQALIWLQQLKDRKHHPVALSTLKTYSSVFYTWIMPNMGAIELGAVTNKMLRDLVTLMHAKRMSPVTIRTAVSAVRAIIASDIDSQTGDRKVKFEFNPAFVDLPSIDKRKQKAPTAARAEVETAISRALADGSQSAMLYAILAGTGLRISEALAIRVGPVLTELTYWDPKESIVRVQSQIHKGVEGAPKSSAGYRDIDLPQELNLWLVDRAVDIRTHKDKLFDKSLDFFKRDLKKYGIPGFHCFRRFRATHLRAVRAPEDLIRYWMGHTSVQVTDRYSKLSEQIDFRRSEVEKIGLGFSLGGNNGA